MISYMQFYLSYSFETNSRSLAYIKYQVLIHYRIYIGNLKQPFKTHSTQQLLRIKNRNLSIPLHIFKRKIQRNMRYFSKCILQIKKKRQYQRKKFLIKCKRFLLKQDFSSIKSIQIGEKLHGETQVVILLLPQTQNIIYLIIQLIQNCLIYIVNETNLLLNRRLHSRISQIFIKIDKNPIISFYLHKFYYFLSKLIILFELISQSNDSAPTARSSIKLPQHTINLDYYKFFVKQICSFLIQDDNN
ncbi:hypothetical protein pb186bvf_019068 [Paramecium bursaria]